MGAVTGYIREMEGIYQMNERILERFQKELGVIEDQLKTMILQMTVS